MSFLPLTTEIIIANFGKVRKLYTEVEEKMGHPTILFNNAGLTLKSGIKKITDVTIEEFEQTWRANCGQAFLLTQLCMPEMEKNGWGRVIFCSSVAGFNGGVVGPHYA
jgi:3-oxoacyl-[acyl-carrier protein] reductase